MGFPDKLTNAIDGVTTIFAAMLNNLEVKVGINGSIVTTSLDYLLKNPASINPGHKHSQLWFPDGNMAALTVDASGGVNLLAIEACTVRAETVLTLDAPEIVIRGASYEKVQTLDSADTINVDWSLGSTIRVALDRDLTTFAFTGGYDGQKCVLELLQDPVGGRHIALGDEVLAGTDLTFPLFLSAGAGLRDYLGFFYHAPSGTYRYVSLARGYSS